ncbi:helix-turn-helix transcriptional regulator [Novosphingobium sp. ERN07]|uniref:helix-turn-helix transcriptional regulator n=1 Tax=Novosphingobium sp. ERN07 TaxID=2726187 RepID=UPI00145773A5|nr:helix-turn-helix transcriptional regulator [Novosphingobium sp. ERN07]NLR72809.1 helix-turn-helix transcriptional regulator [Novosphingobium sp. ERN07]
MRGVTTDPPWEAFVALMRAYFEGTHANLIFRRADHEQPFMTADFAAEVLTAGDPHAFYRPADDPIPYFRMTPLRVYGIEEFIDGQGHPFLAQFLAPLAMRALMIVRVAADNGLQAWLSVTRNSAEAFGSVERGELERIARLFSPALSLFGAWREANDQRDAYARVLRARATGLLRIDQTGRVLASESSTFDWLAAEASITLEDGRLSASAGSDQQRLNKALARILSGESEEELLGLETNDGRRIELLFYRVSEATEPAWANATRAILYLRAEGRESLPSPQRITTLFGLTRREAALALLLSRGLTLSQAAQNLGISVMTARAYLRQVFQKTGLSRQVDLIRQIQASIAAVA